MPHCSARLIAATPCRLRIPCDCGALRGAWVLRIPFSIGASSCWKEAGGKAHFILSLLIELNRRSRLGRARARIRHNEMPLSFERIIFISICRISIERKTVIL